jgi:Fe-S-cluster containining protein
MTECSRCGDCCTAIKVDLPALIEKTAPYAAADPRDEALWQAWVLDGADPAERESYVHAYLDASFVAEHWHEKGDGRAFCDVFDAETRLCTAHDDRPPVCSGFPYYGKDPTAERLAGSSASLRCSYWADVPAEQRPPAWQPVQMRSSR